MRLEQSEPKVWTTLKKLREAKACKDRYAHLRNALGRDYGDNAKIDLCTILEINGLDDVLWIPESAVEGIHVQRRYRLFAVACCQEVLHLMPDTRSRNAVKTAHLHAYGESTDDDLASAASAARAAQAVWATNAAWAVWATRSTRSTSATRAASAASAARAAQAVWATRDLAAAASAATAAWDSAREKQRDHFRIIFSADFDADQ